MNFHCCTKENFSFTYFSAVFRFEKLKNINYLFFFLQCKKFEMEAGKSFYGPQSRSVGNWKFYSFSFLIEPYIDFKVEQKYDQISFHFLTGTDPPAFASHAILNFFHLSHTTFFVLNSSQECFYIMFLDSITSFMPENDFMVSCCQW